jgi:hypothetical protein
MTPDEWAFVWTVVLVAPVLFTCGYLWGRWHGASRSRWVISLEAVEGGVTIRRRREYE